MVETVLPRSGRQTNYLWLVWQIVRLPILVLLLVLEAVVRFVLAMLALCSILTAFLLEFSRAAPNFPFWLMFGFAVGSALALVIYEVAICVFREPMVCVTQALGHPSRAGAAQDGCS